MPLLGEAAGWRLLSCLLERPRPGWQDEVAALAGEVGDASLASCAHRMAKEASEGSYLRVFGPGGSVSPREVAYRPDTDPAAVLARLAALHAAFDFRPASEDPIDHIAVELGFAGYLTLKRAWSVYQGEEEDATLAAEALTIFRREHLDPFAMAVSERLEKSELYLARIAPHLRAAVINPGKGGDGARSPG